MMRSLTSIERSPWESKLNAQMRILTGLGLRSNPLQLQYRRVEARTWCELSSITEDQITY